MNFDHEFKANVAEAVWQLTEYLPSKFGRSNFPDRIRSRHGIVTFVN